MKGMHPLPLKCSHPLCFQGSAQGTLQGQGPVPMRTVFWAESKER